MHIDQYRWLNFARLDAVSLRLVVCCVQAGSLSAAAKRVRMSDSGARRRLQSLEALCGTPLFERHYRGLQATDAGKAVAAHAARVLELAGTQEPGEAVREQVQPVGQFAQIRAAPLHTGCDGQLTE